MRTQNVEAIRYTCMQIIRIYASQSWVVLFVTRPIRANLRPMQHNSLERLCNSYSYFSSPSSRIFQFRRHYSCISMQNVRSQYRRDSSERRSYGKRSPKRLEPAILERVPLDTQVHKQSGGGGNTRSRVLDDQHWEAKVGARPYPPFNSHWKSRQLLHGPRRKQQTDLPEISFSLFFYP